MRGGGTVTAPLTVDDLGELGGASERGGQRGHTRLVRGTSRPHDRFSQAPLVGRIVDECAPPVEQDFRAVDAIGAGDNAAVSREIGAALALLPDDENMLFVRAGSLLFDGRIDEGRAAVHELLGRRATWSTIMRSFVDKGMISIPPGVDIAELLGP